MTGESKDPVASLTARMRQRARAMGVPFQVLLEYYAIFRFLNQLAASPYQDLFILKGGLAFLGWGLDLRRPTRDIDFQALSGAATNELLAMVKTICETAPSAAPLVFDVTTIRAVPIMAQAEHPGVRAKLMARLGNVQIPMQIDFSFSNVITPGPIVMEYPGPIGGETTRLQGYPPETAIAEKLEAMIKWGTANARLKDFYDIWLLSQARTFDGAILAQAIEATCANRQTPIPTELPASLSQAFAEQRQTEWRAFVNKFDSAPGQLSDFAPIMQRLREFIAPVLRAAATHERFDKLWSPQSRWR